MRKNGVRRDPEGNQILISSRTIDQLKKQGELEEAEQVVGVELVPRVAPLEPERKPNRRRRQDNDVHNREVLRVLALRKARGY